MFREPFDPMNTAVHTSTGVIVYVAVPTALFVYPDAVAIAFTVVVAETVKGIV